MNTYATDDQPLPRPCNFVVERDTGTWECINEDCEGGHWFRPIDTDEGNPA